MGTAVQFTTGLRNPTATGRALPVEWWREVSTNFFLAKAVAAPCCGRVNRDGKTLCWSCDDDKQTARPFAKNAQGKGAA
jgi:hypothetical protein